MLQTAILNHQYSRMQLGCCANSPSLGFSDFASACDINSERCAQATAGTGGTGGTGGNSSGGNNRGNTGGASALHSIVGILTSLIFAGLALMSK